MTEEEIAAKALADAEAAKHVETPSMKQLRESREAAIAESKAFKARAEAAEALITESERAKLADNERLTLERDEARKKIEELNPLTQRTTELEATFTKMYEDKIASFPADKQEQARQLSEIASTPEARFVALTTLESLMVPVVVPKVAGTPGSPAIPGTIPPTPIAPTTRPMTEWKDINVGNEVLAVSQDPARAAALQHNLPKVKAE